MFSKFSSNPFVFLIGATVGSLLLIFVQLLLFLSFGLTAIEAGKFSAGALLVAFAPCGYAYVSFFEKHGYGFKWIFLKSIGGVTKDIFRFTWILILTSIFFAFVYDDSNGIQNIKPIGWLIILLVVTSILVVVTVLSNLINLESFLSLREGRLLFLLSFALMFCFATYLLINGGYARHSALSLFAWTPLLWLVFLSSKWVKSA